MMALIHGGTTTAAIYARKSTDERDKDADAKSVTRQVEHATAYARAKGWTVAHEHIYIDDGISGAEFGAKRPGLAALLAAVRDRPQFQVLVISEQSRLGRATVATLAVIQQLVEAGVRVFSYLDDRETTLDDEMAEVQAFMTSWASSAERRKARQRTFDALKKKALAGHVTGGKLFGYDNRREGANAIRVINAAEAAVVRRIFEQVADGIGLRKLAHALNADHVVAPRPSRSGPRGWCNSTLRAIVQRTVYKGTIT